MKNNGALLVESLACLLIITSIFVLLAQNQGNEPEFIAEQKMDDLLIVWSSRIPNEQEMENDANLVFGKGNYYTGEQRGKISSKTKITKEILVLRGNTEEKITLSVVQN